MKHQILADLFSEIIKVHDLDNINHMYDFARQKCSPSNIDNLGLSKIHSFMVIINTLKHMYDYNTLPLKVRDILVNDFNIDKIDYKLIDVNGYSFEQKNYLSFEAKTTNALPAFIHYHNNFLKDEFIYSNNLIFFLNFNDKATYLNVDKNYLTKVIAQEDEEILRYYDKVNKNFLKKINDTDSVFLKSDSSSLSFKSSLLDIYNNDLNILELFDIFDYGIHKEYYLSSLIKRDLQNNRQIYLTQKFGEILNKHLERTILNYVQNLNSPYMESSLKENFFEAFEDIIKFSNSKQLSSFFNKLGKIETGNGPFSLVDSFNFSYFDRFENIFKKHIDKLPNFVKTDFLSVSKYLISDELTKTSNLETQTNHIPFPFLQPDNFLSLQIDLDTIRPNFSFTIAGENVAYIFNLLVKEFQKEKIIQSSSLVKGKNKHKNIFYITLEKGTKFDDSSLKNLGKALLHSISVFNQNSPLSLTLKVSPQSKELMQKTYREYKLREKIDPTIEKSTSKKVKI